MFNCYVHGWSHAQQMCPTCFPAYTQVSSGTTIDIRPSEIVPKDRAFLVRDGVILGEIDSRSSETTTTGEKE